MSKYKISMEIAGPFAMWTRIDTGVTPTSYPVPTWSAVKGIFESVAFFSDGRAWIRPTRVEICKPRGSVGGSVSFQRYTTNSCGPLKAKGKPNFQLSSLIVSDACYRLYASVENGSGQHLRHGDNPCHALQDIFNRRLKKGQCYKTPSLGWNEFVPSYWGEIRDDVQLQDATEVDVDINLDMVSMLNQVFDKAVDGSYSPNCVQGEHAQIVKGVCHYVE